MLSLVKKELRDFASKERARDLGRFFKTGKGEYGEGDIFIGITVPEQRTIAKKYRDMPLSDVIKLLHEKVHEFRFTALVILIHQFSRADERKRKKIYDLYCENTRYVNNWDLVDLSAAVIVGVYLKNKHKEPIAKLARSPSLWERRIAMIATGYSIKEGNPDVALEVAHILLHDTHDLIHKAVGWMLREVGKYCGRAVLETFLEKYAHHMPRTMLRYAIEHFPKKDRNRLMDISTR